MKAIGLGVLGFLAFCLCVGVITFGGWRLGWWLRSKEVNYESHIIHNSFAYQQSLRDDITNNIAGVAAINVQIAEEPSATSSLSAQRIAIVNVICSDAEQLTGDPLAPSQQGWVASNCAAGAISPSSPYNGG